MTAWGEEVQTQGEGVTVGDGYARYDEGSRTWEIGTKTIRVMGEVDGTIEGEGGWLGAFGG